LIAGNVGVGETTLSAFHVRIYRHGASLLKHGLNMSRLRTKSNADDRNIAYAKELTFVRLLNGKIKQKTQVYSYITGYRPFRHMSNWVAPPKK
jgi:hypothetical protein